MPKVKERFLTDYDDSDRSELCYEVYKEVVEQNPAASMSPLPAGVERTLFPGFRTNLVTPNGGVYPSPNLETLIWKILKAYEVVRRREE